MLVEPLQLGRWSLVAAAGFAGALALQLVQRPEPAPEPYIFCAVPDVELTQRFAVPPPASAPSLVSDRRVVTADLLSRGTAMPDCGDLLFETTMVFTDITADSATLRVLVPCAEMPRPMYSSTAGNAPTLRVHARYRLELSGPVAEDTAGKNDSLWRADRIDVVQSR